MEDIGAPDLAALVGAVFADDGPIARAFSGFEPRDGQRRMAEAVASVVDAGDAVVGVPLLKGGGAKEDDAGGRAARMGEVTVAAAVAAAASVPASSSFSSTRCRTREMRAGSALKPASAPDDRRARRRPSASRAGVRSSRAETENRGICT